MATITQLSPSEHHLRDVACSAALLLSHPSQANSATRKRKLTNDSAFSTLPVSIHEDMSRQQESIIRTRKRYRDRDDMEILKGGNSVPIPASFSLNLVKTLAILYDGQRHLAQGNVSGALGSTSLACVDCGKTQSRDSICYSCVRPICSVCSVKR